jgi:hypothetical protein
LLTNIIRIIEEDGMGGTCSKYEINAYTILVGYSEGKRPLGIPRRRWDVTIKGSLKEVGLRV